MTSNRTATKFAMVALAVLYAATMASAGTIRGTSGSGEDSNAPNWLLLGRSKAIPLAANGKTATMTREIVCLNQDVENAFPSPTLSLSGSCDSGSYLFLFQFQSTSANVGVSIGKLVGFVPGNVNNFGVIICDSSANTIEMCSNDPPARTFQTLPPLRRRPQSRLRCQILFPPIPRGLPSRDRD